MPRKENIRKMFDSIAGDYDRLNHLLSLDIDRIWRKKAVSEIAGSDVPVKVLDVACGTGDFAIAIAGKSANASVTGLDLSEKMLEICRNKVRAAGLSGRITMEQGDCEALPFTDNTFDRVSVAFGVRNFEHLEKGLTEMHRVLVQGGKAVILELSVPGNPVLRFLYKLYFLHILPEIGGLVSGDKGAYRYLPASVLKFPKPADFMQMMSSCGFSSVKSRAFTFGICRMYVGTK